MALLWLKAALTGETLYGFHEFTVPTKIDRGLYLVPELLRGQVHHRLDLLKMMPLVQQGKLLIRTLEDGPPVIDEPIILMASRKALVVLDTAIRFMEGEENSADANRKGLWDKCRLLLAAEALSIVLLHHSPKNWAAEKELTLENVFRGTGDIGAMLSDAVGIRQLNRDINVVQVEHLKPRDQDVRQPFQITGRPYVNDSGTFHVTKEPGVCGYLWQELAATPSGRGGNPGDALKEEKQRWLRDHLIAEEAKGKRPNNAELTRRLNSVEEFKSRQVNVTTVSRWLVEIQKGERAAAQIAKER